jgi:anti-anti-sigma factor
MNRKTEGTNMVWPKPGGKSLIINQDMTIYNAAVQKDQFLQALAGCNELDLDLLKVNEMDSAGFQILLLTKLEAIKANKTVRLTAHSKAVTEILDLFNMASYFGDPIWLDTK